MVSFLWVRLSNHVHAFSKDYLKLLAHITTISTYFLYNISLLIFFEENVIGYARVSTQDQNFELQLEALTKAGCQKVFDDKVSGSRAERPGLEKALEMLREGDTLVVWKLDRLGRSVKNLIDLVGDLQQRNIQFKSLTDSIDTGTTAGRFFFHVMASLAEMERELTIERTRAGLEVARQLGRKGGRKPKMTDSKIESVKKLLGACRILSTAPTTQTQHKNDISCCIYMDNA